MRVTKVVVPPPPPPEMNFLIQLTLDEARQLKTLLGQGTQLINGLYGALEVGKHLDYFILTPSNMPTIRIERR